MVDLMEEDCVKGDPKVSGLGDRIDGGDIH